MAAITRGVAKAVPLHFAPLPRRRRSTQWPLGYAPPSAWPSAQAVTPLVFEKSAVAAGESVASAPTETIVAGGGEAECANAAGKTLRPFGSSPGSQQPLPPWLPA